MTTVHKNHSKLDHWIYQPLTNPCITEYLTSLEKRRNNTPFSQHLEIPYTNVGLLYLPRLISKSVSKANYACGKFAGFTVAKHQFL